MKNKFVKLIPLTLIITVIDLLFREQLFYNRNDDFGVVIIKSITSSFVHWDNKHLLWNMFALILIGVILFEYSERMFWLGITLSPLVIGLTVHYYCLQTTTYCGFSGVAFTLLTITCGCLTKSKNRSLRIYGWLTIIPTVAKVLWELFTGTAVFAESANFYVLPASHLAGILVGFIIILANPLIKNKKSHS